VALRQLGTWPHFLFFLFLFSFKKGTEPLHQPFFVIFFFFEIGFPELFARGGFEL
jgi:hypothetical protein